MLPDDVRLTTTGGEGTSEGGSESSSIAGSVSARTNRMNMKRTATTSSALKKKTGDSESQKNHMKPTIASSANATTPRSKSRTATPRNILVKTQSASKEKGEKERIRSRERLTSRESSSSLAGEVNKTSIGGRTPATSRSNSSTVSSNASTSVTSFARTRTRPLPDSLPSVLTMELNKDLAKRSGASVRGAIRGDSRSRTASGTRGTRTPASTPSEETKSKLMSLSTPRGLYATRADAAKVASRSDKTVANGNSQDNKALDTYATLPRRNRGNKCAVSKSNGEKAINNKVTRSRSGSRDTKFSRAIEKRAVGSKESSVSHKSLPPYPRHRNVEKTRIYHETSAQTGLTGQDIENALSGRPNAVAGPEVIERLHKGCQTEDDMQTLQDNLKRLNEENNAYREENEKLKLQLTEVNRLLEEERADHAFAKQELDRNAQRILAMLGTPQSEHTGNLLDG